MAPIQKNHVSISQCIYILISSIIILGLMIAVPAMFTNQVVFTFAKLPLIGDGTIAKDIGFAVSGLCSIIGLGENIVSVIQIVMTCLFYAFYVILVLDVLFSIFLMIFKHPVLRKTFRIISIVFASIMIIIAIGALAMVAGIVCNILIGQIEFDIWLTISNYGFCTFLLLFILSMILIFKQFTWFTKPYEIKLS